MEYIQNQKIEMLVRRAKRQDKEAFTDLMKLVGPSLYKVGKAMLKSDDDIADAMQDTVLTCWEKIDTLRQDQYFKTWVTRVMINHCNAVLRQRKRTVSDEAAAEPVFHENGYAIVEWEEFLSCLEEKYRIVVYLYYAEGYKSREIAQLLDMNENTVRARLKAARRQLEVQYKKTWATVTGQNS